MFRELDNASCSNGSVTVRLRNKGTEAYKRHEYGDIIEIERKIAREGQSSYKISSADGMAVPFKPTAKLQRRLTSHEIFRAHRFNQERRAS